ncbi:hypothetical protein JTE90_006296 [Oedothorax gibbosus]|uniref:Uncharacterized protein n=1 Tax=Oedothorax gibbosus TaxID=931172 RepID=A0AAV6U2H4_9ARAC|nr:hypothetical protein JTE90_006296 [Oedothorax gibbosus]
MLVSRYLGHKAMRVFNPAREPPQTPVPTGKERRKGKPSRWHPLPRTPFIINKILQSTSGTKPPGRPHKI